MTPKTKYILHGGTSSKKSIHNDQFFREFTNFPQKKKVNILLCYWTRIENKWDKFIKRDSLQIKKNKKNINFNIDVANSIKDWNVKIVNSDVFYISGGDYNPKVEWFLKIKNIESHFQGKTIIGSSLGAFLLCKYSINSFGWQDQKINKGLGLLPLNILCHWDVEKQKQEKLDRLKQKVPQYPILTLDEEKFSTFYI